MMQTRLLLFFIEIHIIYLSTYYFYLVNMSIFLSFNLCLFLCFMLHTWICLPFLQKTDYNLFFMDNICKEMDDVI